jgi:hypothetical protein
MVTTADLSTDPGAAIAGRVNALIAAVYRLDPSTVEPGWPLPTGALDRLRLAYALARRLHRRARERDYLSWSTVQDVADFVAGVGR